MNARRRLFAFVFSVSLCLGGSISPAFGAPPRDELLRLVPDDVGFCLLLQDVRGHFERVKSSPFSGRFLESPPGRALLAAPELKKITAVNEHLKAHLNTDWEQLRDALAGDAVVLAYTPGPPESPEQEQGLLLAWSRQPDKVAALFERLNELQKKSGEITGVQSIQYAGRTYHRRTKSQGGDEFFYFSGPVVAFTAQEGMLKKAIDRERIAAKDSVLGRQFQALGVEKCLFVWWVNPRAFDPALDAKAQSETGPAAAFLRAFKSYWKALDSAALFFDLDRDGRLGLAVKARPEDLPAPARQFFTEFSKSSSLITGFPDDALLAVTGRIAPPPFIAAAREFLTPENRQAVRDAVERSLGAAVGKDMLAEVPKRFGPDWGLAVLAPTDKKGWLPTLLAVLRFQDGPGDVPVEQRVHDALNFAAMLVVVNYNSRNADQIVMKSERQGGVEVRYLANDQGFLPGLQPAFAWKGGFLVLASSPDGVRRFNPPKTDVGLTGPEVPVFRLAARGWADYLKAHREPLTVYLVKAQQQPREEVTRQLDGLLGVLDLFDGVELTQRTGPGQVTLTMKLRPAAALKP